MKKSRKSPARKLGSDGGEMAHKQHKHDPNFAQSKDLHEDRGTRQIKATIPTAPARHPTSSSGR